MKKILILGSGGMLGWAVSKVFHEDKSLECAGTVRNDSRSEYLAKLFPGMKFYKFDAEFASVEDIKLLIAGYDWVVNCIGVIKPFIHDDNAQEVERAIRINSLFPHTLSKAASKTGCRIVQIATDCVYSGILGNYSEMAKHDPGDVYGKSKSMGEAYFENIFHLRCSIIGLELGTRFSLMEWFLGQPQAGSVNGFTNHDWNGVTTYHYGLICKAIIKADIKLPHIQHVVPGDKNTKHEMLKMFADYFNRADININAMEAKDIIDRTLSTASPELNRLIWNEAGYAEPPSIEQMISEYSEFCTESGLR
jgi:dTDP-4-dehydrorhamnose reductase